MTYWVSDLRVSFLLIRHCLGIAQNLALLLSSLVPCSSGHLREKTGSDKVTHYLGAFIFTSPGGSDKCAQLMAVLKELALVLRIPLKEEKNEGLGKCLTFLGRDRYKEGVRCKTFEMYVCKSYAWLICTVTRGTTQTNFIMLLPLHVNSVFVLV